MEHDLGHKKVTVRWIEHKGWKALEVNKGQYEVVALNGRLYSVNGCINSWEDAVMRAEVKPEAIRWEIKMEKAEYDPEAALIWGYFVGKGLV